MFPFLRTQIPPKYIGTFSTCLIFILLTLKILKLLKQMQVLQVLFLINAGYFSGFIQKLRVGVMAMGIEESLIDCTCVRPMHTYMPRTPRGRVPSETHFWKEWLTQAPPIPSSVPKNRCQFASFRHRAKINSAVPSTCLIDPSVELASTPPIAFRGLGNLLYTKRGRKLVCEEL